MKSPCVTVMRGDDAGPKIVSLRSAGTSPSTVTVRLATEPP